MQQQSSTPAAGLPRLRADAPRAGGIAGTWLSRHSLLIFMLLTLLASLRIAATYTVFSHTVDEPAHLACGMQWLSQGAYNYETQHPPLGRVAAALGPFLAGESSHGVPEKWQEGLAILGHDGHYQRNLALARLGILPFFWLAAWVVYAWSRKYCGELQAVLATLLFTSLPPILAHAGLATTDMALTATIGAAFLAAVNWCERPSPRNSLVFGAVSGLAVLSKFSALVFLPLAFASALASLLLFERPADATRQACLRVLPLCGAVFAALLVIWAGYRFSFGTVPFASVRLPFPELYDGVMEVVQHNRQGHYTSYLLGERRDLGWWYYYFIALGVKTPLAFLGLLAFGVAATLRRPLNRGLYLALAFSCAILLFCTTSSINLGIRHILPVYLGFSVTAAAGAALLIDYAYVRRGTGWLAGVLLLCSVGPAIAAHPDYLAYFNALAGPEPQNVLIDSDLDWGQDLKRLSSRLHQLGATQVALTPTMAVDYPALDFPAVVPNDFIRPVPGWNAIRLSLLQVLRANLRAEHPEIRMWPDHIKPAEKIGKGILLWYFPPEAQPTTASPQGTTSTDTGKH
jgi:hypothetical protein